VRLTLEKPPKNDPILETAPLKVFKTGFTNLVNPLGVPQELKENVGEISEFHFFGRFSILVIFLQ
jgi:hypothetical protein